jgi:hypothetical protein
MRCCFVTSLPPKGFIIVFDNGNAPSPRKKIGALCITAGQGTFSWQIQISYYLII